MKISAVSHPVLAIRLALLVGGSLAVKSHPQNLSKAEPVIDALAGEGIDIARVEGIVGECIAHIGLSGDVDTALSSLVTLVWADIVALTEGAAA
jgi:hypothetical protein